MGLVHTPIQKCKVKDKTILVKREDLCVKDDPTAPPFSKVRGIYASVKKLIQQGYTEFHYVESAISMAGWGLAWVCKQLGVPCKIWAPKYKTPDFRGKELYDLHFKWWLRLGAKTDFIPAGRTKVNWYIVRQEIKQIKGAYLMPIGLSVKETIFETEKEAMYALWTQLPKKELLYPSAIVCCVGSGTIAAGILRAWAGNLYGILSRTGSVKEKHAHLMDKSGLCGFGYPQFNKLKIINEREWEYTEKSEAECPFPCHPYYDLKAWQWITDHIDDLPDNMLFWNIGSNPK
jgi:hypothetical protein